MYTLTCLMVFFSFLPNFVYAQSNIDGGTKNNVQMYVSPRNGSFVVGSVFDVGIYIDTKNSSINALDLKVNFDPKKLAVAKPSGGTSIFGIWVEPPTYDNVKGYIKMSGVIPEGIVTSSGLITTMSFKVLASGTSNISIDPVTNVYNNDGIGSKANVSFGRSVLLFTNPMNEGLTINSDTHPFEDNWYNNNNIVFTWDNTYESTGYSFILDGNPKTVPVNEVSTMKNTTSYTGISDGTWYFHIKSKDAATWGLPADYKVHIDTTPPEKFKPTINTITSDGRNEYLLLFNTTDALSGVDHYEVGVLRNSRDKNALPVFIQTESPYVLPTDGIENITVVVKAFDGAGNVTQSSTSLYPDKKNWYIAGLFVLVFILLILHYMFGHHIGRNLKRAYIFFKNISHKDEENL